MLDEMQHRVESISGPWWGVIAGAAVIGAILFPDARGTAAAVAGGVAFIVAAHQAPPCCDSCANGGACAGASSPAPQRAMKAAAAAEVPNDIAGLFANQALERGGCR